MVMGGRSFSAVAVIFGIAIAFQDNQKAVAFSRSKNIAGVCARASSHAKSFQGFARFL